MGKLVLFFLLISPTFTMAGKTEQSGDSATTCNTVLIASGKRLSSQQLQILRDTLPGLFRALAEAHPSGRLSSRRLQELKPADQAIVASHLMPVLGFSLSGASLYLYARRFNRGQDDWRSICKAYHLPEVDWSIGRWVYFEFLLKFWVKTRAINTKTLSKLPSNDPLVLEVFHDPVEKLAVKLRTKLPPLKEIEILLEDLSDNPAHQGLLNQHWKFIFFIFDVIHQLKHAKNEIDEPILERFAVKAYAPFILAVINHWQQNGRSLDAIAQEPTATKKWLVQTLQELITGDELRKLEIDYLSTEEELQKEIERVVHKSWFWKA